MSRMFETFCVVLFACFVAKFAVGVFGSAASVIGNLISLNTQRMANRQMRERGKMGINPYQQHAQTQGSCNAQDADLDARAREFIKDSCSRPRPNR